MTIMIMTIMMKMIMLIRTAIVTKRIRILITMMPFE